MRGRHTAIFDEDMRPHAEALGVVRRLCGSELARESDCPDALFSVSALASSRASSLPQDRCAAGGGTPTYLMKTCAPTLKRLTLYTNLVGAMRCRGRHADIFNEDMRPTLKRLALYTNLVGASLLAKAIVQTPCFLCLHWPIREQAPTGSMCCRRRHTDIFDEDMRPNAEALGAVRRLCGSELARESDCPDALFFVSALAYSRASSLPQDRCAAGGGTPTYLMTTCAPTLKRLALYAGLVGAISTRRGDET